MYYIMNTILPTCLIQQLGTNFSYSPVLALDSINLITSAVEYGPIRSTIVYEPCYYLDGTCHSVSNTDLLYMWWITHWLQY